jgi:hypothetical protein
MHTETKRSTVAFDPEIYQQVRARADELHVSLSQVVNELLREAMEAEDREDLAIFEERAGEPEIPLEEVIADMKARGRL